jgi:hypothetical protein
VVALWRHQPRQDLEDLLLVAVVLQVVDNNWAVFLLVVCQSCARLVVVLPVTAVSFSCYALDLFDADVCRL